VVSLGLLQLVRSSPCGSRKNMHSFPRFLVKRPILEKSSSFEYYKILLFSEEPQKISKLG
jgi:hypothetical protein